MLRTVVGAKYVKRGCPIRLEHSQRVPVKSAVLQYIAGARLCGSEKLLQIYWFEMGHKKGICMALSSVCRAMQGSCPFWWPQQLGVFLASACEAAVAGIRCR